VNMLATYSWPGNVRELSAVIERAAILGDGKQLDVATALGVTPTARFDTGAFANESSVANHRTQTLGVDGQAPVAAGQQPNIQRDIARTARVDNMPAVSSQRAPVGNFAGLDDAMRGHIEAALARAKGRIEGPRGAAKLLGINPHTLRARMRKLKIDWQTFRPVDEPL
jgi:DNA-binding NtrC family response regulator